MRELTRRLRAATWLELFFDLCFVAAVAALAQGLHADPTLRGLWHFAALFVPVWWAWMQFTWFATAWDNDDLVHRLGMLTAMLIVVVLDRPASRGSTRATTGSSCSPSRGCRRSWC